MYDCRGWFSLIHKCGRLAYLIEMDVNDGMTRPPISNMPIRPLLLLGGRPQMNYDQIRWMGSDVIVTSRSTTVFPPVERSRASR